MDLLNEDGPARSGQADPDPQSAEASRVTMPPTGTAMQTSYDAREMAPDVDHTALRDGAAPLSMSGPGRASADKDGNADPYVDRAEEYAPATEAMLRKRRTFAQRTAAAQDKFAALETEKRKLRTRGAIVAGALLVRLAKTRPALVPELATTIHTMQERDREALRVFAPELGA